MDCLRPHGPSAVTDTIQSCPHLRGMCLGIAQFHHLLGARGPLPHTVQLENNDASAAVPKSVLNYVEISVLILDRFVMRDAAVAFIPAFTVYVVRRE